MLSSKRTIDLSHVIHEDMPVYPADKQPVLNKLYSYEKNGVNLTSFSFSCHTGTHIDCPSHFTDLKCYTDNMDVSMFMGKAIVLKCESYICNNLISEKILELCSDINNYDYIIFNTGTYHKWGSKTYFSDYPTINDALIKAIADSSLKGFGVDTISIDKCMSNDYKNHKLILSKQKVIIENLTNLDILNNTIFDLFVLPLKIRSGDGSPVRAIAVCS